MLPVLQEAHFPFSLHFVGMLVQLFSAHKVGQGLFSWLATKCRAVLLPTSPEMQSAFFISLFIEVKISKMFIWKSAGSVKVKRNPSLVPAGEHISQS